MRFLSRTVTLAHINRRELLRLGAAASVAWVFAERGARAQDGNGAPAFDYDWLVRRAQDLAAQPYNAPDVALPDWIAELDDDSYRKIAFNPDQSLLRGTRFSLQFFHPGYYFDQPVAVSLVEDGRSHPVDFDMAMFNYDGVEAAGPMPEGSSFSGFRLHYPLNLKGLQDEFLVFQGASYFRFLGSGQQYGLSARGLAVDTATTVGEEFPQFLAFWIEKPAPDAETIRFYALLDSPSVAGAYRFEVAPGDASVMHVDATLFVRADIEKLGIAPLTSMFLHGEENLRRFDDYRPEVHDSDGLLMLNGAGEWLWRALSNPAELAVSSFVDNGPKGFGLFQRDSRFTSYQDLEMNYHLRPSYWFEPDGNWGEGHVELVEIPSEAETNDNVVAFWVPKEPVNAGHRLDYAYRITALDAGRTPHGLARVVETFIAPPEPADTAEASPPRGRRVILDFAGERMAFDSAFIDRIEHHVNGRPGEVSSIALAPNPEIGGVRLTFVAVPEADKPMDLRASLSMDGQPLSESWFFVLRPSG